MEHKLFATLGIITIASGLSLAFMGSYVIGISGTIVGIWLASDNIKKIKAK